MHKRQIREELRETEENNRRKRIVRSWMIAAGALLVAFACYAFDEEITELFMSGTITRAHILLVLIPLVLVSLLLFLKRPRR